MTKKGGVNLAELAAAKAELAATKAELAALREMLSRLSQAWRHITKQLG